MRTFCVSPSVVVNFIIIIIITQKQQDLCGIEFQELNLKKLQQIWIKIWAQVIVCLSHPFLFLIPRALLFLRWML